MEASWLICAAYVAGGYLLGSILFGHILPKAIKGIDITAVSRDGNPGTANAMRYAGIGVGLLCLLGDLAKGFVPVFFGARQLGTHLPAFGLVLAAPVLGHAFSAFRNFRGGKAIAVSFGVLLGLLPRQGIVWILAGLYLFFSLILPIRPHERRTVWTFGFFALFVCALYLRRKLPFSLLAGSGLMAAVVIYKNLEQHPRRNFSEAGRAEKTE